MREMTGPEMDTVLAALRLWQNIQEGRIALIFPDGGPCGLDYFEDVATNAGQHEALDTESVSLLLDEVFGVV